MRIRHLVKKLIVILLPVGPILVLNRALRALASATHHLQFVRQWRLGSPVPHFFDPFIDLYWKWEKTRNPMSWERGIFGLLAMKAGCRQLDLCCGEGFYTHRFYSGRAGNVVAIDYNQTAIAAARRKFHAPNIDYLCGDIRSQMPQGPFDNITWDAGIEYFTPSEIAGILSEIKVRLAPDGILSGYCIPDPHANLDQLDNGRKFATPSPEALGELLHSVFRNVTTVRTVHTDQFGERVNCYFFAGDGQLPFGEKWSDCKRWAAKAEGVLV